MIKLRVNQSAGLRAFLVLFFYFVIAVPANAVGLVSTGMEIEIGRQMRDDILAENRLWENPADNSLIQKMGDILVPMIEQRPSVEYEFYIIEDEEVNAFALPGGIIFVNTGLLDFCDRDPDMVAGVLAHEISHVARRHHKESLEYALLGDFGLRILFEIFDLDDDWHDIAASAVYALIIQGYSRENEYDADRQAVLITYEAGWDPERGILKFLRETEHFNGGGNVPGDLGRCIASHPDTDRRVYFAELYYEELQGTEEFHPQPIPDYSKPEIGAQTSPADTSEPKK